MQAKLIRNQCLQRCLVTRGVQESMGNWERKVKSTEKLDHNGPRSVRLEHVSGCTTVRLLLVSLPRDSGTNIWHLSVRFTMSVHAKRLPGFQAKEAKWVRVLSGKAGLCFSKEGVQMSACQKAYCMSYEEAHRASLMVASV